MQVAATRIGVSVRDPNTIPRWLHWWAVLAVLAALPLLLLGAEVTTKEVGMVDQVGLRVPWHILIAPLEEKGLGYVIEHSHRAVGWVVGMCAIVLAAGAWFGQANKWLRWLGLAALVAVCLQGTLGILRVKWNPLAGREFALLHGCLAQLVFALLVSVAYLTSFRNATDFAIEIMQSAFAKGLRRQAFFAAGLIYAQVVVGAIVRHTDRLIGPRLHLVLAFAVTAAVVGLLVTQVGALGPGERLGRPLKVLACLVGFQLLLGVEAWMSKFGTAPWSQLRPLITDAGWVGLPRSLHSLVGALLFASSVVVALQAWLQGTLSRQPGTILVPCPRMEGVG